MRDVDATLATFTTDLVVRLCEQPTAPDAPPIIESFGILLQADIAGSSALAGRILAKSRGNAADEFAILLNDCFAHIVTTIQSFGGEIVDFGGDSVLAIWECEQGRDTASQATATAAMAALKLNQLASTVRPEALGPVAVRCAISAGPVTVAGIGGLDGDRRLFVTGRAIGDLAPAANKAEAGETVVSASAWTLAQGLLKGRGAGAGMFLLEGVANLDIPRPKEMVKKAGISDLKGAQSYVPRNVRTLSEAALDLAGELRTTTMVFCRIKAQQLSDKAEIHTINAAMRSVQDQCKRYHGLLETVRADDKGTIFMTAFGLPPTALLHRRSVAIGFAHHVSEILQSFGYEPGIGIATGRVFQGPIGVAQRRQFAFIGSPTILGCRLMQLSVNEIICDEATRTMADMDRAPWGFAARGPYELKGFDHPVPVFSVIRKPQARSTSEATRAKIIGRAAELKTLEEQITKVAAGHRSLTLIEGQAGVGKTLFVSEALRRSELAGCKVALGRADPLTESTPYSPWRQILTTIFDLPESNADKKLERTFRKYMLSAGVDAELLPLLNDVFGIGIKETQRTRTLPSSVRARCTQKFLADVIDAYAKTSPLILVLEDIHWIDVPSVDLCVLIYEKCRHVGLVLTRRPAGELDRKLVRLLSDRGARRISLANLDRDGIAELVRAHTASRSIPRAFLDTIYAATEGNPFFVEQVLKSYRRQEGGTEPGRPSKPEPLDLMQISVPSTVEMAILQRIDELDPKGQLLLKSASALGESFKLGALIHANALKESAAKTKRDLQTLIKSGFIIKRGSRQMATYAICHQLMRKVTYDLIPRTQLTQIHGRIARWYESGHEGPRANYFSQLAHHWLLAGAHNKALAYLSRAGERSLKSGAHTEARHFFQTALDVAGTSPVSRNWQGGGFRLAKWEAQLAQSLWSVGALNAAPEHACRALRLIGFRVPNTRTGWLLLAARQWSALQLPLRTSMRWDRMIERRRQVMETGAVASIVIAQVAYYTADAYQMLAGSLLSLRLGSPSLIDTSAGRSYGYLGYMAGVMRLHGLAGKLFRQARARSTADEDVVGLAYAHGGEALYQLGYGRWSLAEPAIRESLALCRDIGDPQLTEIALTLRALLHYFSGDFLQSERDFTEIFTSAKKRLSHHHLAWGAYGRAENLIPLGKARQAYRLVGIAQTALREQTDLHSELICHGLAAIAQLRLGKFAEARHAAVTAIDLAQTVVPNNFSSLEGYAAPIETLLTLRQIKATEPGCHNEDRRLKQAFKSLTTYARLFPIGRPRLWYLRGLQSHIEGKRKRSTKHWLRSLDWASYLSMRYEEYRACAALVHFGLLAPDMLTNLRARAEALSSEYGYEPAPAMHVPAQSNRPA